MNTTYAKLITAVAAFASAATVYAIRPTGDAALIAILLTIAGCTVAA